MRALVVRRYGPPNVFELQQLPDPQPKPGEVLIRVKTIGVNFADLLQRMGLYPGPKPPLVPGLELAGVVEKIVPSTRPGDNDERLSPGDAVAAIVPNGAYAEWAVVPSKGVYRLPPGMTFEDGAAVPVVYLTAYHSMFAMGNLQPGDRILIHGAAGGVGIAAVQLARARGLTTFGTAGPTKQDYLRKLGVDHPIDHQKSDFVQVVRKYAPDGIEMVMDPIGGRSLRRGQQCLGPGGRLVIYGLSDAVGSTGKRSIVKSLAALAQTPRFHPLKLMSQNLTVIGVSLGKMESRGALLHREMDEVFRLYTDGKIKPVISKIFRLEDAAAAHQYIHDRKNIGKVILSVR
jgi:synaptic vesicle membrane protein VAT-1